MSTYKSKVRRRSSDQEVCTLVSATAQYLLYTSFKSRFIVLHVKVVCSKSIRIGIVVVVH